MVTRLLIIDDEEVFREDLAGLLRRRGITCYTAASGEEGVALAQDLDPAVVLCDVKMPGMNGIETLDAILRTCPETSVIMVTAYGDIDTAIAAFRKGACDYVVKPVIVEDVFAKVSRLLDHRQLSEEVKFLRRQLSGGVETQSVIGESETMKRVLRLVEDVAPTPSTVLLTGESGTGKEVIARAIHERSPSSQRAFIPINCAGIPEQLLESELFGHVRGAFTGAVANHTGYFEFAGEGTILLDEISEMPPPLQAKLLRVLEQKEFVPVGGVAPKPLHARVIVATNRDLRRAVDTGAFRQDLYFRIAVFEISLPPLRQRRVDIPLLVEHFVAKLNFELKRQCLGVSREAMRCLLAYSWPGNVRELRNVIERAMIVNHGDYILENDLPEVIAGADANETSPDDLRSAVRVYEREYIMRVISECGGNKEEAARRLNVNPSTLYRKLSDLGPVRREPASSNP